MTPGQARFPRPSGVLGAITGLLTREAGKLPLRALTIGAQAWEHSRGLRSLAARRGNEALQIAAHTPLGRLLPQPSYGDNPTVDEEAERLISSVRSSVPTLVREPPAAAPSPPARPAPAKPEPPAPAKPEPSAAAVEVGAPGTATPAADQVAAEIGVEAPQRRDDLPVPDFDNISLGSLRARLRSLSLDDLAVLRAWESEHAHRLPVLTLLENRIAKLAADTDVSTTPYPSQEAADRR